MVYNWFIRTCGEAEPLSVLVGESVHVLTIQFAVKTATQAVSQNALYYGRALLIAAWIQAGGPPHP